MIPENMSIGMKIKVKIHSSNYKCFEWERGIIIFIHGIDSNHFRSERYDIRLLDGTILKSVDPEFIEEVI